MKATPVKIVLKQTEPLAEMPPSVRILSVEQPDAELTFLKWLIAEARKSAEDPQRDAA
jgi:hypothetical protein